jgi:hypothetical protein
LSLLCFGLKRSDLVLKLSKTTVKGALKETDYDTYFFDMFLLTFTESSLGGTILFLSFEQPAFVLLQQSMDESLRALRSRNH